MMAIDLNSELLNYIVEQGQMPGKRLPPLDKLAEQLGISTSKLREQLEVARALELVEIKPKIGIHTLEYSFLPCVRTSIMLALALDPGNFEAFGVLRNHLEVSFWKEAVSNLEEEDKEKLLQLVESAWEQLRGTPIQIPHREHRDLHLTIFSRLKNPFVLGILEAYWEAYEAVGLNLYSDYQYLERVWSYHEMMIQAIVDDDLEKGYNALVEHIGVLQYRPEMDGFRPSVSAEMGEPRRTVEERSIR
jgi:DNA-binding FadR family transcriptional regulator